MISSTLILFLLNLKLISGDASKPSIGAVSYTRGADKQIFDALIFYLIKTV